MEPARRCQQLETQEGVAVAFISLSLICRGTRLSDGDRVYVAGSMVVIAGGASLVGELVLLGDEFDCVKKWLEALRDGGDQRAHSHCCP